jgi:DNA sulfur modification protein DndB
MSGIIEELCTNEKELKRTASKRKKSYEEKTVEHSEVESYKQEGWEVLRIGKSKTRMKKTKPADILFEDRVWMIFYNLGFRDMNKDRKCKLEYAPYTKQIDVLSRDDDNVFIVECKSSESESPINAKVPLEEFVGKRDDIKNAIQSTWGRNCGRINIIVAISSQDKRPVDEEYVIKKKDKNIYLWSAREIKYIEDLVKQVGSSAKYQLYSVIFAGRRQSKLKLTYPAIRGKIGPDTFYTFLIPAKQLLKYSYIHHRHLTGIVEASQVYQRMLRDKKLKEIARFVDEEEGYFPNSIIVNFSEKLRWDKKESYNNNIAIGTVTLPEYFGCAWIIDGQHRLYGAARARGDVLLPVLAFENLKQLEQANLFVDINVKQTSVEKHLLWDLYSDIYKDSGDEKQKFLYQIAEVAKKLNDSGPLKGYIDIPSIPTNRPVKLSLTTICDTIQKYSPWSHIKHPNDESKTPDNVARFITCYYTALKTLWPEDWAKGNKSVLLTNNGFGVFMMVFNDIINHIVYKEPKKSILQPHKIKEFEELLNKKYLKYVIENLKTDADMQKEIIRQTGRGPQSDNAAYLDTEINKFMPDFSPPRIGDMPANSLQKEAPAISSIEQKAQHTEPIFRAFVLEKLKNNYGGDKWWKHGIPGGPKSKADKDWGNEIKRKPYLQREQEQNEKKFEFLGIGELKEIVIYGDNWDQIFQPIFLDKEGLERRIKDIMVLRNPTQHKRTVDDQDVADGISGLLWLSKCLTKPELNPYT